jgi:hypothetical protein
MTARVRALVLSAVALAACGGGSAATQPSFQINGTSVFVHSDAAFTQRADLPGRLQSTVDAALAYWGGSWADLTGRSISLEGAPFVSCHGIASATGCFDGDIRVSTSDYGRTVSCVEETELVHEVGHAVLGDASHTDPRWMDFAAIAQTLSGRTGYTSAGETGCPILASVWQHPPNQ